MSDHPKQQLSKSTGQHSPTTQVAVNAVAKGKPAGAEPSSPSRLAICAVAACIGVLILLEPLLIDTKPGLQVFQAVIVIWFWVLFMFAGPSDRGSSRK